MGFFRDWGLLEGQKTKTVVGIHVEDRHLVQCPKLVRCPNEWVEWVKLRACAGVCCVWCGVIFRERGVFSFFFFELADIY